ncbi:MAG: Cell division initiation protein DivIVA [Firmicutes bacterium]|nr:Cell division initiation protein DivIVA [Bacillota bacterium]MDI6705457.1 DivIVA domain-containing protein [Bacillota bacterium]
MITPLEIQNKQFAKKIRGYDEGQVDDFLDRLTEDYENLYRENANLKDRLRVLEDKLQHYSDMEASLQNALIMAQNTAEEATKTAHDKGRLIIEQAEEEAKRIIERSYKKVEDIENQYQEMKRQVYIFRTRFKTLLEAQLETVVTLCEQFDE